MTTPPQTHQQAIRSIGAVPTPAGPAHCDALMDTTRLRHRCNRCGITIEHVAAQHPGIVNPTEDDQWIVYQHSLADSSLNADPGYTPQ